MSNILDHLLIRTVTQKVSFAEVIIMGKSQGKIEKGLVILFGVGFSENKMQQHDEMTEEMFSSLIKTFLPVLEKLADKILNLRIFPDEQGKMNVSVKDIHGGIYVISQFTLFADCTKGNRPSFIQSAPPFLAQKIYDLFLDIIRKKEKNLNLCSGIFGENMQVSLCNDGPVTIVLNASSGGLF